MTPYTSRQVARQSAFCVCLLAALSVITGCDRQDEPLLLPEAVAEPQLSSPPKVINDPVDDELPWNLLGKSIDGPEVAVFVKGIPEVPMRTFLEDYGTFVSFHESGLDLLTNVDGEIITIIVYGPDDTRYGEYRSSLPFELDWSATRSHVEKKLGGTGIGAFYHSSVNDRDQFSADYPHLGLYLTYSASSKDDLQARLLDIRRKLPE